MNFGKILQVAASVGLVAAATACGGDADADGPQPAAWDTTDPCTLVASDTIESLVTDAGEGVPTDSTDRRSCLWGKPELMNTVAVTVAALPQSTKPLRTLEVGEMTGTVLAETKYQCILELETDSGVLSVEAKFGLDAALNPDMSCDRVAPLSEQATKKLAWA
ncbi:hypothetical protein [Rhodococcus sp. NPDC058521]|uniref:hypothetical protein n=1 Tax=Rhodococcus sp. NPDC058521 TaxID=3346536 RepID=UPI003650D433